MLHEDIVDYTSYHIELRGQKKRSVGPVIGTTDRE
jgi:hypothetical protein